MADVDDTVGSDGTPQTRGLSRRQVLRAAAVVGATTALTLEPLRFAAAADGEQTQVITGHLDTGAADFVYLPVVIPRGVREIAVSYSYDRPPVPPGTPGNALDIGVFDQRGTALGGKGFRGWSGGFRTSFAISASEATPGYLPGPVGAGSWNVVLGPYQVAPQGLNYRVEVTLRSGPDGPPARVNYPPTRIAGRGAGWYRGDCHLHTVYSDGRRLPSEVAQGAREAGLDFMVSTDHNTSSSHGVWGQYAGPDLLILLGEEVTTRNGHYLTLGLPAGEWVDWRYRARDDQFEDVVRQVSRSGGLIVPAHPYCPYVACRWKFGYDQAHAIEVWNGPWTDDDEIAVQTWDNLLVASVRHRQPWLPAMGNSDAHNPGQVIGLPHNVVRSTQLERDALLTGIRRGTSWIAESAAVSLDLTARGGGRQAGIGERLDLAPETPVEVALTVRGAPGGVVRLLTDEGQLHLEPLPSSGSGTVTWRTTPSLAAYVRAEVRKPVPAATAVPYGAMTALTNPVFLGRAS